MIDRKKAYVGMKVIRRFDKKPMTVNALDSVEPCIRCDRYKDTDFSFWYLTNDLDPAEPEKPLESAPTAETKREPKRRFQRFDVNDTIRMPHYDTVGKGAYRVWQIIGVHLGATHQEGTYALKPLDIEPNEPIHVPCVMLETHPEVEKL